MNPEKAEGLSPELQAALEPLLAAVASVSEHIAEYNQRIDAPAQQSYPEPPQRPVQNIATFNAHFRQDPKSKWS